MKDQHATFGSYNVKTGESLDGYIDKNGKMAFKKRPWYKRIFKKLKPTTNIKYIGSHTLTKSWMEIGKTTLIAVPVYMKFDPFTDIVYNIYSTHRGHTIHYCIDAYLHDESLILN